MVEVDWEAIGLRNKTVAIISFICTVVYIAMRSWPANSFLSPYIPVIQDIAAAFAVSGAGITGFMKENHRRSGDPKP